MQYTKNNKKILSIGAFLLCASMLSACGTDKRVGFTPYWAAEITAPQENIHQKLEYDVTFEKSTGIVDFSLNYENGKYVTELTTESLQDGTIVYRYTTKLTIDATYVLQSESFTSQDVVSTEAVFHTTKEGLKPISSKKELKATSPVNNLKPTKIDECYTKTEYTIITEYNDELTSGESKFITVDDEGKEVEKKKSFSIGNKLTYLDNEQLLFAISGINPHESANQKFSVYAPLTNAVQTIKVGFTAVKGQDFKLTKDGETGTFTVQYFPVSISINDKNAGATQTAWYASHKNSPEFRNVLLQLKTPVSYGLGTLTYVLTNATFSK